MVSAGQLRQAMLIYSRDMYHRELKQPSEMHLLFSHVQSSMGEAGTLERRSRYRWQGNVPAVSASKQAQYERPSTLNRYQCGACMIACSENFEAAVFVVVIIQPWRSDMFRRGMPTDNSASRLWRGKYD
jgi:hypothetical protein